MARKQQEKSKLVFAAEVISLALNPVNMIILMVIGVSIRFDIPLFDFVAILSPFFILTLVYIVYKLLIKKDSDLDMTKLRMRRHIGYFSTAGFIISFILSHLYFPFMDGMFLRASIVIIVAGLVTLKWKISFHAIGYTSFCFTFVELFGPIWGITLILLPLVFWSRLILKRHTMAQLVAGSVLSLVIL